MRLMRLPLIGLALLPVAAFAAEDAEAEGRSDVYGLWAGPTSILEVAPEGDSLRMTVVAIDDPLYGENEPEGPPGTPRRDLNNPDPALRDRPIVGMNLLEGYAFDGRRWTGKVYDPESGNRYSSNMRLDGGELKMRGYIGVALLGRTESFAPASRCEAHVVAMAEQAGLGELACD